MKFKKRGKWKKRLGKVATAVVAAGAVAGVTALAGGRGPLEAIPETLEDALDVIPESKRGELYVLENFFMIGTAVGVGFVGYKLYYKD